MVKVFTSSVSRDLKLNAKDEAFILKPFDHIFMRQAPSYFVQQTVNITGEVLYPGSYSIRSKNERISDLIKRSGGISKFAYIEGATLQRDYKIAGKDMQEIETTADTNIIESSIKESQINLLELKLTDIINNPGSVYDFILKEVVLD
jgi:protein involved in polysaccharide export with SLBB domain